MNMVNRTDLMLRAISSAIGLHLKQMVYQTFLPSAFFVTTVQEHRPEASTGHRVEGYRIEKIRPAARRVLLVVDVAQGQGIIAPGPEHEKIITQL